MQAGMNLVDLAKEVERVETAKKDFMADTAALKMVIANANPQLSMNGNGTYGINEVAHDQLSDRLGIPRRYYNRMLVDAPELLTNNVNHWFTNQPDRKLVRTLDGNVRAFLSDKYRPLDNYMILQSALPVLAEHRELKIKSCGLTERRLYVQAVSPRLQGEVAVGDLVQAGIVLSNSEVGLGLVKVESLIYRLACKNGMIRAASMSRRHVGRRIDGDDMDIQEYYTTETIEADIKAFMLKVRDTVANAFNEIAFQKQLDDLRAAAGNEIKPSKVQSSVEEVTKRFGLLKEEGGGVLGHLIQGGMLSQWGLANAVTTLAHDVDSYDRGVELERIGGKVIDLSPSEWRVIAQ